MRIDIHQLKSRLPVSAVLRAHGHTPRANRMPCPIHAGDNQSAFSIKPGDRFARCWSCGWAGDVIALEHVLGGGTVAEAMQRCAGMAGLAAAPKLHKETERRLRLEAELEREAEHAERRRLNSETAWWGLRVHEFDQVLQHLTTIRLDARLQGLTEAEESVLDLIGTVTDKRDLADRMAEEWRLCLSKP